MKIQLKRFLLFSFLILYILNVMGCSKTYPLDVPKTNEVQQAAEQPAPSPAPVETNSPAPHKTLPTIRPEKVLESEKLYEQGFSLYNEFKYDEAITYFTKAIDADPSNYKAYNGKGIALCFKKNYTKGMELIKKSLELKPDFPYANFNMAMAYKLQNDLANSLIWFEKTLSYDSNDTWSYYGISTIYADWNDIERSIEYLKKAVALDPAVKNIARTQSHYDKMRNNPEFISITK